MENDNVKINEELMKNTPLMRQVIDNMDYMVRVMDADHKVIYMNRQMRKTFGHKLGLICYDLLGKTEKCEHCVTSGSQETGKPDAKDVLIGERYYNVMSSPVSLKDGANYSIEILHDITDQKKMEMELLKHYEKLKSDIEFAKNLQTSALPADGIYWDMVKIHSKYTPSEDLGGDFFDLIKVDENNVLLYIADVAGHGIRSSLVTIFLRQLIRARTFEKEVDLNRLFDLLLSNFYDLGLGEEQYLSILICCYNKEKKEMTFLNAGHNCLPMIISKKGEIKEVVVKGFPVCSIISENKHQQVNVDLETGDRILLYTDGITESYNSERNESFGSEGIAKIIAKNFNMEGQELVNKIVNESRAFSGISPIDDMAVMLVELL